MKNGFGVVIVAALLLGSVHAAIAGDVIINSGSHDGSFDGFGFTGPGNLTINGGTFNNNSDSGAASFKATSVTITGGTFEKDLGLGGFFSNQDSSVDISGGTFEQDAAGFDTTSVNNTVSGGLFENNEDGIEVIDNANAVVTITAATFSGNSHADLDVSKGTINVYGTAFSVGFGDLAAGDGTFSWTDNSGVTQNVTYDNSGTIDLIDSAFVTAAPEPNSLVGLAVSFGICALLIGLNRRGSKAVGLT
jgi:hypothetical protein